jgi:threonine/homoserine/homoserine lactone efflux protein
MTLVLVQALQHGSREGCKVALAPLVTDAPIIVIAVALASQAAEWQVALAALSITGSIYVLYLAVDTLRWHQVDVSSTQQQPNSWLRGVMANLLSPNPWLFWMTIGAATLAQAMTSSWLAAAAFLGVFYLLLVGIKLVVAVLAGRSRTFLKGRVYQAIMWVLGLTLIVFAVLLFRDGVQRLMAA